ncbi:MAG: DUF4139 domain-containing protein [Flavobacteriales bacterium]|nr:DUF4139 domain-containing protein [Flavobacteriales bacterium]
MKKLLFIVLLFSISCYAEKQSTVKSKINKVTVYQQGAQIYRKASFQASKGINTIIIEGISPNIDPNSLQVNASGNVILLDSKYNVFYPEPEPVNKPAPNTIPLEILKEISMLNDSIFEKDYQITEVQYKIDVLQSEKRIIENNGTIKGQGKVNDSIPLLRDALEFYHIKMNEINKELLSLNRQKTLLNKDKNRMNTRLTQLNNYNSNNQYVPPANKPPVHRLEITLSAKEATSGRISVSYLVNNAGWIPMYDLRSSASNNSIELTYKAHVFQNTGIDWSNVRLNLSTNNPYANKTKPVLHPWYLDYYTYNNRYTEKDAAKKAYPGGVHKNAPAMDYSADESLEEKEIDALTAKDFTQLIEQLISVEYAIDLPYNIKSDNKKNMVLVDAKKLDTEFMYYTIPKLDLATYLVARITDLGALNLVPGKANLFHDGGYIGETWLDPSTMNDTLDLSLGKDPNIITKRTLLKKESKEKVVGDKIVKTFAYKIELKNHKKRNIKLILQDQIPVVRNSEIEVALLESSKGKLNEITGILNWDVKLKPSESKSFELIYTVKYEKTKNINLASR